MTKLAYPFVLRPLTTEDGGGFLIEFPDLPGCISDGETAEEAMANGEAAMKEWITTCKKLGRTVPKPASAQQYSGKVLQRFPKSLHARLAQRAREEGVSLNQLVLSLVAEGLGRRMNESAV